METWPCSAYQGVLSCVSGHGRKFLLFLFASALLSGPLANTVGNMERTASSLLCAQELAANQTQELLQRAATPLYCKSTFWELFEETWMSVVNVCLVLAAGLDRIRRISREALSATGRVRSFMDALADSVRHVGECLHRWT